MKAMKTQTFDTGKHSGKEFGATYNYDPEYVWRIYGCRANENLAYSKDKLDFCTFIELVNKIGGGKKYRQEYKARNRDKFKKNKDKKRVCECGFHTTESHIGRHRKTAKHHIGLMRLDPIDHEENDGEELAQMLNW